MSPRGVGGRRVLRHVMTSKSISFVDDTSYMIERRCTHIDNGNDNNDYDHRRPELMSTDLI